MLVELLNFGRWLAVHRRYQQTSTVCVHLPQWLIAKALGVHDDTVRRYLKRPAVQRVVRAIPHYTDGYFHRIIDGLVVAIALDPIDHPYPRIAFEAAEQLRDLEHDAAAGRVRGSYSPQGKSLSQALQAWVLSSGAVPQTPEQAPVVDPRRPVDKLWNALRDLHARASRTHVTAAAQAIVAFTRDDARFVPGWCSALWRIARSPSDRPYHQLVALLARHSDAPTPYLGKRLLLELKLSGA